MKTLSYRRSVLIAALTLGLCAATGGSSGLAAPSQSAGSDTTLANDFSAVSRSTPWALSGQIALHFKTYHTEGLAITGDRIFLSAVQVLEPTRKYPKPRGRYDRTPGRGIGHVFVLDRQGHLERDIVLGEGDMYHPAGMDFDGKSVWVPVAQYRPNSSAIMYRIDAKTLGVHRQFQVDDHIGGVIRDNATGHLIGNNWGSREFYEWTKTGRLMRTWLNPSHFVDYQDCQHIDPNGMLCGGITELPQSPAAGGDHAKYELGGMAMIDLPSRTIVHEIPFQYWSSAGHVVTRNPLKVTAQGKRLTLMAAPDNGNEGNGTELLTYQATVGP